MADTSEISASVVYREGPLAPEDYQEAIEFLQEAKANLEIGHHYCPCGDACAINQCHHNPLVMARRAVEQQHAFRCYHCGLVCLTEEEANDHFGTKEDALPSCLKNQQLLIALMKVAVQLAIIRHDLNSEEGHTLQEPVDTEGIAQDVADAIRGIGTCSDEAVPEWKALFQPPQEPQQKPKLSLASESQISFNSNKCPGCDRRKDQGKFCCPTCWPKLPTGLRRVLWKGWNSGPYITAFAQAVAILKQENQSKGGLQE
jgi:hypothetical protein